MTIKYLSTYTVHNMVDDSNKTFASSGEAHSYCQRLCGNSRYVKPFPEENTYLYGPGNGDTTLMIRQDIDMDAFMGRTK